MSRSNKTNRFGKTRKEMNAIYPHPVAHAVEPSKELYDHLHWVRSDWKNKTKCAICGEKVKANATK